VTREDLLTDYGRFYGEQHFAVTFTASTTGDDAKRVTLKEWDKTAPLADGGFGAGLIGQRGKSRNIAIVLRPSHLVVMECDSEEDLARLDALELPATVTVRSSQPYKRHYYFRPDPAMEMLPYVAFRFESGKVTADSGRYFLAPPSIHPSGVVYSFLPEHGPGEIDIATLPETIYRKIADQARIETGELRTKIETDPQAKIHAGNRRDLIFRYACMLRRWGLSEQQILANCNHFNETRCDPPVERSLVAVQVTGAMKKNGNQELAHPQANGHVPDPEPFRTRIVPLNDFISVTEDIATPLMGAPGDSLLPADGLLFMYGDGGAGKTTLSIDALAHLASGTPWLEQPVPAPVTSLLIENEGPRGPFRETLKAKVDNWNGDTFNDRTHILEEPWTRFTLDDDGFRAELAAYIDTLGINLVIVGPLASLGARGAGTPDDVNNFALMIGDLRARAATPFALWIVHHENKQGDVSGAWERLPDTLVHVSAQGNGRTRVHWRKVRWSSRLHNTSVNLLWDNGGFTFEEARVRDLQTELLDAYQKHDVWRTAREASGLIGANQDKVRETLMQLVASGQMEVEMGPPGRRPNAKCWRLTQPPKTDSDTLSHHESLFDFSEGASELTQVTPPTKESPESSQEQNAPQTDSDSPSQITPPAESHERIPFELLEPEPAEDDQ
jgi:hypothetical protein